jgi:hypothetical protein
MTARSADYVEAIDNLPAGAIIVLQDISWKEYEQLLEDLAGRAGVRVTYDWEGSRSGALCANTKNTNRKGRTRLECKRNRGSFCPGFAKLAVLSTSLKKAQKKTKKAQKRLGFPSCITRLSLLVF